MSDVFAQTNGEDGKSVLDALVGEGKKFKTVEDLARSKLEADAFIEKLKDENKQALSEIDSLKGAGDTKNLIEELRKAISEKSNPPGNQPPQGEDLVNLVKSVIQGESESQTKARNREQASKLVLEKVGNDPQAVKAFLAKTAEDNGFTVDYLRELSERSPKAFAKLIDAPVKSNPGSVSGLPNHSTDGFNSGGPKLEIDGHKTKAWYDAKMKEMGARRFINDASLQREYMRSAMALGPKFYNP